MSGSGTNKIRVWQVVLLIFLPFVGGWFFTKPGKPKAAQYLAMAYCLLMAAAAFSALAEEDLLVSALFYSVLCILPVLNFLDNKVLEKRALRKAQSEELEARVKEIIETEPRLSTDEHLDDLERKYS